MKNKESMILNDLIRFPIVMLDSYHEQKREEYAKGLGLDEEDPDIVEGEAECPYWDFLCVTDRWLPTKESFEKAKTTGEFDACTAAFSQSGIFCVPMKKKDFLKMLKEFMEKIPPVPNVMVKLTKKQMDAIEKEMTDGKKE